MTTTTEPVIKYLDQQYYAAIHAKVEMNEIAAVVPGLLNEVFAWLAVHDVQPWGALIKYNAFYCDGHLELEAGVITAAAVTGDGRVCAGIFPAGNYAMLTHMGHYSGLKDATAFLEGWIEKKGLHSDETQTENSVTFTSRVEFYPTDPATEPDPDKWQTDIVFLLKDEE